MPACEWEPTHEQQRAFYRHVLEGKTQFLGGFRVTYEDGVRKTQEITPQESRERAIAEALKQLRVESRQLAFNFSYPTQNIKK